MCQGEITAKRDYSALIQKLRKKCKNSYYFENVPNVGSSETGITFRELPFVTVTVANRGVPIITGSEPVRWWELLPLLCFNVCPGDEWTDRVSPFDFRESVAEFGAKILNLYLESSFGMNFA